MEGLLSLDAFPGWVLHKHIQCEVLGVGASVVLRCREGGARTDKSCRKFSRGFWE